VEPTIFKPRLKFKPPLKFFKFGRWLHLFSDIFNLQILTLCYQLVHFFFFNRYSKWPPSLAKVLKNYSLKAFTTGTVFLLDDGKVNKAELILC